jgi:putative Mg2+ transporter-C (MgtC) family protein
MLPLETMMYRLLWAALLGALVGLERIRSKRPAGLRTSLFVCMGSALFTIVSAEYAKATGDASTTRIASNIVQGIGFLGAGVILREKGNIVGVTTAATIFLEAAMGMTAGAGLYKLSGFVCVVVLFALVVLAKVESVLKLRTRYLVFRITADDAAKSVPEIHSLLEEMNIPMEHLNVSLAGEKHIIQFDADLSMRQQEKIVSRLMRPGVVFDVLPTEKSSTQ